VAVIRLSGPAALAAVAALTGRAVVDRTPQLSALRAPTTGELLDRGLVLAFRAPASFTGEDVAELQVHGGRAVVAAILDVLAGMPGLRLAEAGEFTRRAFENGKLDLTATEGLADLIAADTEAQRRQALTQAEGAQARLYERWRSELVRALARIEAGLDFADEADVPAAVTAEARPLVERLRQELRRHLDDGHRGEVLREGFKVVLAGPPNVGKSSLLNALARRDLAIVSPEAGTTRDAIEVRLDIAGLPVLVTDTAGLRTARGDVEQEGIRRSLAHARAADLVLWLVDSLEPQPAPPDELAAPGCSIVPVVTKADLLCGVRPIPGVPPTALRISVRNGRGIEELLRMIEADARVRVAGGEAAVITRLRHRRGLEDCVEQLDRYLAGDPTQSELRAEDLRLAATALGRVTGRVGVEDVLDEIFGAFCIGK
jgi:tRNA modification GTPase